ncbi:MAG: OmpA family protein [Rhodospirillaceae bacterium]|nr:OmpA family protein [Rhodospirillaceae bacterium]MBT5812163.1 OmpA family protein [Rhodospirillaceae bacterium]
MKFFVLPLLGVSALLVGACAEGRLVDDASKMKPTGSAFNMALHGEYVRLAKAEHEEGDYMDAGVFARHAAMAGKGMSVDPDGVYDRDYSNNNRSTLLDARARLLEVLAGGGASMKPSLTAKAQANFDCWAQELEENTQPKDIAACKKGFDSAMRLLETPMMKPMKKMAPKKMVMKGPRKPVAFVIYFDHDSAFITEDGRAEVNKAAAQAVKSKSIRVSVVGHTDTSGSKRYNKALSDRRAKAVDKVLGWEGVNPLIIEPNSMGENAPAERTGDSVKSFQNRRVTVTVY